MTSSIDILFEGLTIGPLRLPNRFVMAPMTRNFSPAGIPTGEVAAYYTRRAEGGVGLIITEGVGIDHPAAVGAGSMGERDIPLLHGEPALAGWSSVIASVHAAGGRIAPQLWHMGPIRLPGTGYHPDAPSTRPSGLWGPVENAAMPRAYLDQVLAETPAPADAEIAEIIDGYARSAANAWRLGFDAVALHGAHGYLIDSFLWSSTNRRTDRWGGDPAGRARFAVEIVKAVRAATAPDFPIIFRYSQWKLQDYGARNAQTPADLEALLGPIAEAGVDVFDASTRKYDVAAFAGSDLGLAGWTKAITGKPTMAVGGVGISKDLQSSFVEPTFMTDNVARVADHIGRGEFDLIGVGRALLMDPRWVAKLRSGEPVNPFRLEAYATLD